MQRYTLMTARRLGGVRLGGRLGGFSANVPSSFIVRAFSRYASDSITYSGGQATEGQGGYYGSGGARVMPPTISSSKSSLLALAADVDKVTETMQNLEKLEAELENISGGGTINSKTMELSNSIKKLVTGRDFLASLNRLEIKGEPVWGLSENERELIILAREKVNSS